MYIYIYFIKNSLVIYHHLILSFLSPDDGSLELKHNNIVSLLHYLVFQLISLSLSLSIYIYIYMYIYIYIYIYRCFLVCVSVCTYICVRMY